MKEYNPTEERKAEVLKNWMLEHFDYDSLKKAGIYTPDIKRKDYKAQADRMCTFLGFNNIFEYGAMIPVRVHLTYAGDPPIDEDFVIEIKGCFNT